MQEFNELLDKFTATLPGLTHENFPEAPQDRRDALAGLTYEAIQCLRIQMLQGGTAAVHAARTVLQVAKLL
jgi:hypothetical protein